MCERERGQHTLTQAVGRGEREREREQGAATDVCWKLNCIIMARHSLLAFCFCFCCYLVGVALVSRPYRSLGVESESSLAWKIVGIGHYFNFITRVAPPGGRIWCKPDALIERMSEVASRNLLPSHSPLSLRCWLCQPPNPLPKTKNGRTCNALITLGNPECKTPPARQRQPYPKCEMNLPRTPYPYPRSVVAVLAGRVAARPKTRDTQIKMAFDKFFGGTAFINLC